MTFHFRHLPILCARALCINMATLGGVNVRWGLSKLHRWWKTGEMVDSSSSFNALAATLLSWTFAGSRILLCATNAGVRSADYYPGTGMSQKRIYASVTLLMSSIVFYTILVVPASSAPSRYFYYLYLY